MATAAVFPRKSVLTGARRLLLGPAGCGKSRRLLGALVDAVRGGREAETLLLVPTASYRDHTRNLVLRELVGEGGLRGFSGAGVCTFRDLLNNLLARAGLAGAEGASMSAARQEFLVRRLLRELDLPAFEGVCDFPGFRDSLVDAVEEVRRAGLGPDGLEAALRPQRPPAEGRHACFLRFYRAWNAAIEQAGAGEAQTLEGALNKIRAGAVPLALLLVDGFSDFTHEQRQLLAALVERAPVAMVALMLDRQPRDLFYQAERSRAWLKSLGFEEEWLEGNPRAGGMTLRAVEGALRTGRAECPPPLAAAEGALELLAAADRRDEAELIGREVLRLVREGRSELRYRDIGIIVRQPAAYVPLLRGVFRRLGVPLRAFFPLSLADTATGRHLRLCLEMFGPETRPESIIQWLKSPYSTILSRHIAERFEYRAVERLVDARAGRWEKCLWPESPMHPVINGLLEFDSRLVKPREAHEWIRFAKQVWRSFSRWTELPDGVPPGRVLELRAEAAAFRRVEALLDELGEAAAAENAGAMRFEEFREVLFRLLSAERIPLRDRRLDAVNLMNPFEARQWELPVVFVAGLVEKEFPAPAREQLFLDDGDRHRIESGTGVSLPATAHRALDERLLFYVAATRARQRLYLSYPQSDAAGAKLLRSFFLRPLDPLLDSEFCAKTERRRSEMICPVDREADEDDLLALVHAELAHWPERTTLRCAVALYERLRERGATSRAALALASRAGRLQLAAALELLRTRVTRFSASDLRNFALCAFRYFAERTLRLEGPPEPKQCDPLAQGDIAHTAIEQWERGGRRQPIGELLDRCFDEKLERDGIPATHQAAKARDELKRALERFAGAEREHDAVYRTAHDPKYVELRFGGKDGTPCLELALPQPDGAVIYVPGRIDRVEAVPAGERKLGLLIDYKYSASGFSQKTIEEIAGGIGLQLPVYLLALERLFNLTPAGAEIYALKGEEPGRRGVYDLSLVKHIFHGPASKEAILLAPESFRGLVEQGQRWIERHALDIRSGIIGVLPQKDRTCEKCALSDLCRVTPWETRSELEQAVAQ